MQRGVLLGAGAVVVVAAGVLVLRGTTQHEASKAVDQTIEQLLVNLPPDTTVKHGATSYNPLTSTMTVHDLTITRANVTWVADTLTISGADQKALHDVFDPTAYPGGKPAWTDRRLLLTDAAADGVHATVTGPNALEYTIHSVTLHRLTGRPFALPPTPENRARPGFGADAALAFSVDSATETNTRVDASGASPNKLTIGSIEFSNYDGGKLGSLAIKNVAYDGVGKQAGKTVRATLDSFSVKDADAVAALASVQQTGKADAAAMAKSGYGSLDMAGLAFKAGGSVAMTAHDVHAEQVPDGAGLKTGRVSVNALTVGQGDQPVSAENAAAIAAFGMNTITMDLVAVSGHKPNDVTTISEDLTLHDLGMLHLKASFSGYVAPTGAAPAVAIMALMGTTLESASLVWDDNSLTDRIFKTVAARGHTTPELIRSQLAMPVLTLGVLVPDQPDVADQVTAFLTHPHQLAITLTPTPKVSFAQVAAAPATTRAHLLGVHVTGN